MRASAISFLAVGVAIGIAQLSPVGSDLMVGEANAKPKHHEHDDDCEHSDDDDDDGPTGGGGQSGGGGQGGGGGQSGGGGGGGGNKGPKTVISGAGQRLHFSFGASLRLRDGKLRGGFTLFVHPLAPPGNTLAVVCRYKEFKNASLDETTVAFDAHGVCHTLSKDGKTKRAPASNHVTIVDSANGTDQIDVDLIGPTGVSLPGGALDFGQLEVVTTTS